jgi:hypothetical protein
MSLETVVGIGMISTCNPAGVLAGSYIVTREIDAVYDEAKAYIYRHYSGRETSRDRKEDNYPF